MKPLGQRVRALCWLLLAGAASPAWGQAPPPSADGQVRSAPDPVPAEAEAPGPPAVWADVQAIARRTYTLADDHDDWFGLVFSYPDGRSQKVFVRSVDVMGTPWVEIRSVIGPKAVLKPTTALHRNRGFGMGAIAMDRDDDYVFIVNRPISQLDADQLVLSMNVVAQTADELEREFAGVDTW